MIFRIVLLASAALVSSLAGANAVNAGQMNVPDFQKQSSSLVFVSVDDEALKGAERFVDNVAERGIGFLSDSSLSEAKKARSFRKLLKDSFDIKTIARFSLGQYWRTASDAEKAEYEKLFEEMIIGVYSNRFSEYNGEQLTVNGSRPQGSRDILVNSSIVPTSGSPIQLDWRVRYKNGQYKVVDVIVEGVSMAQTQRSDFSSVIQRGGGEVEVLLAHLRQK